MTIHTVTTGCHEVLRLRPGVYRAVDRNDQEYLLHRSSSQRLGRLTESQREVLRQLADCEGSGESLRAIPNGRGRDPDIEEVDSLLHRLRAGGWLHITVARDDRPAYTIEPYRRPANLPGNISVRDRSNLKYYKPRPTHRHLRRARSRHRQDECKND